ncbi:MAG TPA: hypothetical protein VFU02_20060 [Polyangiaceae bacterium]|nr:hypothetical protein [Polyangiaceae bacterium]
MTTRWKAWLKRGALLTALTLSVSCGGTHPPAGHASGSSPVAAPGTEPAVHAEAWDDSAPAEPMAPPVVSQEAETASAPASAAEEGAGRAMRGPSKPSSAAPSDEAARSRPGLGTVWGEDRESNVHHTVFHRADPGRPFALATLFYNDREGISAMASESARSDHGDSGFRVMNGAVTVRLLDQHGRSLPALEVASREYVVGEHGQAYSIEVENHTNDRIEAVATVDGLDVVDGEEGSFSKRGYVIGPFDSVRIDGFRRSTDTVAAFRFGSVRDSYAGRKGKARNVGVIGVALFHEIGSDSPWLRGEVERRHTADPFPGRFAEPPAH